MKKVILVAITILFLVQYSCITDQNKYKETDIFEEFETEQGFVVLHLPPVLFKLFLNISGEGDQTSNELLDKIDVIKVLFFEENNQTLSKEDVKNTMNQKINDFDYNLLTRIAQEDNDVSIYIIEKEKIIHEVLFTILSENEYIGLNVVGSFTKDEVLKVYQSINMQKIKSMDN